MTSTRSLRGVRVVRFGEFELDVRAAELRRNGEKVRLQEQPFRLLAMLLEHPGEVVLREEIRKRFWPNGTVVEESHGINAAVLRLREALGDSAGEPTYIETIARRGYRFKGQINSPPAQVSTSSPRTENLVGKMVGHYRIIDKLGSGGMGVVYRAEDLKLGRQVALKFLPPELIGDSGAIARFDREARAASALSHPNICTVHAVEDFGGQPVIVMELAEGQTLEVLLEKGALSAPRAIAIAIQLAGALEAAHQKGIAHRDLKPGNVLLTTTGLKVLDFGLAHTTRGYPPGTPAAGHVTQEGAILGTPHYMSPEQVQGRNTGEPSDIFSFGLVLYEMLTGRRAFDGLSSADVMAAILTAEPAPLPEGTAPSGLERILRNCLAKNPADRWSSATELKAALETAIAPVAVRRMPRVSRRGWIVGVLAGLAVLAVLGVASVVLPKAEVQRFSFNLPAPGVARVSLSPDGQRIAFVSGGRLYIRGLDARDSSLLFSGIGNGMPFWSPDGRFIAFADGSKLRTVATAGGAPSILCDVNTTVAGTWGPDGTILIGLIGDGIFRIPATGGTLTRVTTVDTARGEARHMMPQFLPDGRRFLFLSGSSRAGGSMLYAASLDAPGQTAVMPVESTAMIVDGYILFARGTSLMAQRFDAVNTRVYGLPFDIASPVANNVAAGAALGIAHFSASTKTLAYAGGGETQGRIQVVQNWTELLR